MSYGAEVGFAGGGLGSSISTGVVVSVGSGEVVGGGGVVGAGVSVGTGILVGAGVSVGEGSGVTVGSAVGDAGATVIGEGASAGGAVGGVGTVDIAHEAKNNEPSTHSKGRIFTAPRLAVRGFALCLFAPGTILLRDFAASREPYRDVLCFARPVSSY